MTEPQVWVDGHRHAAADAKVSAIDRGVLLADGLFETMRCRNGRVFRQAQHRARLDHGLRVLGIPSPPLLDAWLAGAVTAAGSGSVRLRLTITRGVGPPGLAPPAEPRPTVVIAGWPMADVDGAAAEPVTLHVASGRRNERSPTANVKTLAYTDAVVAMLDAQRHGASDALFLDTEGHCSETTGSNLFIGTGGALWTPPVSCGALPGVTRAVMIELAAALAIPCLERPFGLDDLFRADEAFVTNAARGMTPVAAVNDRPVGAGGPAVLTQRLAAAYAALVRRECP